MAAPPLLAGGVNTTDADRSPALTAVILGEPGVVRGVVVTVLLALPGPTLLTARSWMRTGVPLVNPLIVTGLEVDPVDRHAPEPSNRYW